MNQVVFNNEKITPSKVIFVDIRDDKFNIKSNPNEDIASILESNEDNSRFKSEIAFIINEKKIIGVGLCLYLLVNKNLVFSDFVAFDGEPSSLSHNIDINDELIQKSDLNELINIPSDIIQKVDLETSINDNDILIFNTQKHSDYYEECDLFMGSVYLGENQLAQGCWEAL